MSDFENEELGNNLDNDTFDENAKPKFDLGQKIKPYVGTIIKVLILLGILAVAYYFFFYRYTTVSFSVFNYETNSNETTTISLTKDGKSIPIDTDTEIKLLSGDYSISIQGTLANQYLKTKNVTISKDLQNSTIPLYIYPEWVTNISEFKLSDPTNIYTNQEVTLNVSLKNNGKPITVTFKGTGDLNTDIQDTQELKQGENTFQLKFKVIKKQNEKVSGYVYLDKAKDLPQTKTNEFKATIKKAPTIKITNSKTVFETSAGRELKITFDLSNSSQEEINGLNFIIEGPPNIDIDILKSYITQLPADLNINKNSNISTDLILTIPLQTNFEGKKEIYFTATFANSYVTASKKITINYTAPNIILPKLTDFGTIIAGTNVTKEVSLENSTKYSIKIKESKINILSQTLNLENALISQIGINNPPETLEPGKTNISITAMIPATFISDKFNAELQLSTDIGELKIPLSFTITGIDVKLEPSMQKNYTFVFEGDPGLRTTTTAKNYDISIKNSGNVDLNNISISITSNPPATNCNTIISTSLSSNLSIAKGESQPLFLTLKSGVLESSVTAGTICNFDLMYIDPRTNAPTTNTTQFSIS